MDLVLGGRRIRFISQHTVPILWTKVVDAIFAIRYFRERELADGNVLKTVLFVSFYSNSVFGDQISIGLR